MSIFNPSTPTNTIVSTLVYADSSVPSGNTIASQSGSDVAFTSSYTIPANSLKANTVIRIKAQGIYGTALIAPTITGKLKITGADFLTTGTVTSIAGVSNSGWTAVAELVVTNIGATGHVEAQGYTEFATAATTSLSVNMSNTSSVSLDTTVNNAITITINWGTNSASNTITLRTVTVDILNI